MENSDLYTVQSGSGMFDVSPSLWVDTAVQQREHVAPSPKRGGGPQAGGPLGVRNAARREFEKLHSQLNLFTQGVDSPKRSGPRRMSRAHKESEEPKPRPSRAMVQPEWQRGSPSRAPWGTDDDETVITKLSNRKFHLTWMASQEEQTS